MHKETMELLLIFNSMSCKHDPFFPKTIQASWLVAADIVFQVWQISMFIGAWGRCSSLLLHKVLWGHPLPSLGFSTSELPVGSRQVASYVNVLKTEREGRKTTGQLWSKFLGKSARTCETLIRRVVQLEVLAFAGKQPRALFEVTKAFGQQVLTCHPFMVRVLICGVLEILTDS